MYQLICHKELVPYAEGLLLQQNAFSMVRNQVRDGIILVLQHRPVYTIGTGGGWQNMLFAKDFFDSRGIDIIEVSRGGNVTFHGPGQIVVYPVLDLTKLRKDAHWYIECLEEVVVRVLKQYGISGTRKPEYRGVWIGDEKIAAVGVSVKRWITQHGLSFNIDVDKTYFDWINPCGIKEFGITSLEDHVSQPDHDHILRQLADCMEEVFEISIHGKEEAIGASIE